jgi:hypothetical protein
MCNNSVCVSVAEELAASSSRLGLKWRQQVAVKQCISTQYDIPEDINVG